MVHERPIKATIRTNVPATESRLKDRLAATESAAAPTGATMATSVYERLRAAHALVRVETEATCPSVA